MNPRTRAPELGARPVSAMSDAETVEVLERTLSLWRHYVFSDSNPSKARPQEGKRKGILREALRLAVAETLRQLAKRVERGSE